ncbi:MAG TPA: hypothetical protein VKV30_12645 [Candidatus Angelobacter sp.]|nr:hypothetical protein [Candidatus Angelobacter sp.]
MNKPALALLLSLIGIAAYGQGCDQSTTNVKIWLQMPPGSTEWAGIVEKQVDRSGDAVAIGIARTLTPKEMLEPNWLDRILPLIRHSFRNPDFIVVKEDREPRVTLVLLSYLKAEITDENERKRVIDTLQFILQQTQSKPSRSGL